MPLCSKTKHIGSGLPPICRLEFEADTLGLAPKSKYPPSCKAAGEPPA